MNTLSHKGTSTMVKKRASTDDKRSFACSESSPCILCMYGVEYLLWIPIRVHLSRSPLTRDSITCCYYLDISCVLRCWIFSRSVRFDGGHLEKTRFRSSRFLLWNALSAACSSCLSTEQCTSLLINKTMYIPPHQLLSSQPPPATKTIRLRVENYASSDLEPLLIKVFKKNA